MKRIVTLFICFAIAFLAGLIGLPRFMHRALAQQGCNWMQPGYSTYAGFSTDGSNIYTSVVLDGSTGGYCPYGSGACSGFEHAPATYNLLGSTGGWTSNCPSILWNSYTTCQNNQFIPVTDGTEYTFQSQGQVQCGCVGIIYNSGLLTNYVTEWITTLKTTNDLGGGVCVTQPSCFVGVTPLCWDSQVHSSSPCAAGFYSAGIAYRLSTSDPWQCFPYSFAHPTTVLPGYCTP